MFIAAGADLEVAVRTAGDGQVGAVLPQMNQIVHKYSGLLKGDFLFPWFLLMHGANYVCIISITIPTGRHRYVTSMLTTGTSGWRARCNGACTHACMMNGYILLY